MSRSGKISRFFGDADHDFKVGIGEAEELQEVLDCGLMRLLGRVGDIDVVAVRHVLRVGLVGAGMKKEEAFRLVKRHHVDGYLVDSAQLAVAVLEAALRGAPEEALGEPQGEAETSSPTSPMASSASASSTASEASWASLQPRSVSAPSGSSAKRSRAGAKRTARKTAPAS